MQNLQKLFILFLALISTDNLLADKKRDRKNKRFNHLKKAAQLTKKEQKKINHRNHLMSTSCKYITTCMPPEEIEQARENELCFICQDSSRDKNDSAMLKTDCCKQIICLCCRKNLYKTAFKNFDNYSNQDWINNYLRTEYDRDEQTPTYVPRGEKLKELETPSCPACRHKPFICQSFLPKKSKVSNPF